MVQFWKDHTSLRLGLMAASFVCGMLLIILGWLKNGQMAGLGIMLIGVVLLLFTLWLYNIVFTDVKPKKNKR